MTDAQVEVVSLWDKVKDFPETQPVEPKLKNVLIEKVFRLSLLQNSSTNIILEPAQIKALLGLGDSASKPGARKSKLYKSASLIISANQFRQGPAQNPKDQNIQAPLNNFMTPMILYRRIEYIDVPTNSKSAKAACQGLTKNTFALVSLLEASLLQPADIYLGGMALMKSIIEEVEAVNIFDYLGQAVQDPGIQDILASQEQHLLNTFARIRSKIETVQVGRWLT